MNDNLDPNDDSQFADVELGNEIGDSGSILDGQEMADDQAFLNDFPEPDNAVRNQVEDEQDDDHDGAPDPKDADSIANAGDSADDKGDGDDTDLSLDELGATLTADEQAKLKALNDALGSDYKNLDEVTNLIKKDKEDETIKEIQKKENLIDYYENILGAESAEIVFEDEKWRAQQKGLDVNDDMVIQEIKDKIERWEDSGALEALARGLKAEVRATQSKYKTEVNQYRDTITSAEKQKVEDRNNQLTTAAQEFYARDDFYGTKLEKKDILNAYKEASKGSLIDIINSNPKAAYELQLLWDQREKLASVGGGATYGEGVKDAIDKLNGHDPKLRPKVRNNRNRSADGNELISDFLK